MAQAKSLPSASRLDAALARRQAVTLAAVPDGLVGKVLGDLALSSGRLLVFVARDGQRLAEVERTIRFFAPSVEIIDFPAWDCLPYDRSRPIRQWSPAAWRRCRACSGPRIDPPSF